MESNHRISDFNARWRRLSLNTYWLVLMLSCVGSGLNILLLPIENAYRQDPHTLLIVTLVQIVLIATAEWTLRYRKQFFIDTMIVLGAVLAATLCIVNKEPGILFVLVLPILVPTFLGQQQNRTLFSLAASLVTYFLLILFHETIRMRTSPNEVILIVSFMVSFAFITVGVHKRGSELLEILLSSIKEKQEIERVSKLDALTGLSNHRNFHETLERHLDEYDRKPFPLYLLLLDLDSFKKVNDTYGHLAGDLALKYVAGVLQTALTDQAAAFRYGGEEFAVLLTHCSPSEAARFADQIREEIAKQAHPELGGGHLSVSIGVSRYRPELHKEELFAEADACLYEAKHTGKNKVVVHKD